MALRPRVHLAAMLYPLLGKDGVDADEDAQRVPVAGTRAAAEEVRIAQERQAVIEQWRAEAEQTARDQRWAASAAQVTGWRGGQVASPHWLSHDFDVRQRLPQLSHARVRHLCVH